VTATSHREVTAGPSSAADASSRVGLDRVGPNAIIQLGEALLDRHGRELAREVYEAAGVCGLLDHPPQRMVDEQLVATLFRALRRRLPADEASAVAADAGERTARYLLANRIPGPARALLKALPAPLSARLLLRAMAANAWTFAGSGSFRARAGSPHRVEIVANPIAMPGCVWHVAVFQTLFRALVAPRARAWQTACCREGALACSFEIAHAGSARGPEA